MVYSFILQLNKKVQPSGKLGFIKVAPRQINCPSLA